MNESESDSSNIALSSAARHSLQLASQTCLCAAALCLAVDRNRHTEIRFFHYMSETHYDLAADDSDGDESIWWYEYDFDPTANRAAEALGLHAAYDYFKQPHDWNLRVARCDRAWNLENLDASCEALRQWAWTINMMGPQRLTLRAAVFLDLGNVLSELTIPELAELDFELLNSADMQGIGILICTRGMTRWKQIQEKESLCTFSRSVTGTIVTDYLSRYDSRYVTACRPADMRADFIALSNGDKGDAARLVNLPVLLFDDREENIIEVERKGPVGSKGILVSRHRQRYRRTVWPPPTEWKTKIYEWLTDLKLTPES